MVMLDKERNAAFEVFAHTGRSCLITCLMLIEDLLAAAAAEEKALLMFYGETPHAALKVSNEVPGLHLFTKPRQAFDLEL